LTRIDRSSGGSTTPMGESIGRPIRLFNVAVAVAACWSNMMMSS